MLLLNLSAGKAWGRRCREWTCGPRGGGYGEGSISTYTVVSGAGETVPCSTGKPVWGSVMT